MARRLIALTDAQQRALAFALKHMSEDGHDDFEAHWKAIERQMKGDYTPQERTAIFDGARRLLEKSE